MNTSLDRSAQAELEKLSPPLRALLDAELAAGNAVAEVAHGFPAPPVGALVRLAHPFRAHTATKAGAPAGLKYRDWPAWDRSGGYTDDQGHFFVLGPVPAPVEQPSMDEIRARLDAQNRESSRLEQQAREQHARAARAMGEQMARLAADAASHGTGERDPSGPARSPAVQRFVASMAIDYEKWREGIGYDLDFLRQATPAERTEIEQVLVTHGVHDWRDVEALAACDTDRARRLLTEALEHPKAEIRLAVARHAPELIAPRTRVQSLLKALREDVIFSGLSQALDEVERFHPPEIITELWRGVQEREGEVAVHFAAMLSFVHGATKEAFDWGHRPFFLKFHTEDRAERTRLVAELRTFTGVTPAPWNGAAATSAANDAGPVSPDDAEAAELAQLEALAALEETGGTTAPPAKRAPRAKPAGGKSAAKPAKAPKKTTKKKGEPPAR